jgi:hypothetical protein
VSAETVAFVGALVHAHPTLLPTLQEHLDDLDGEVLPHLLMADIERWAEREVEAGRSDATSDLAAVLGAIELAFKEFFESEVGELISVSFLEHLPRPKAPGSVLRDLVGPRCAAALDVIG